MKYFQSKLLIVLLLSIATVCNAQNSVKKDSLINARTTLDHALTWFKVNFDSCYNIAYKAKQLAIQEQDWPLIAETTTILFTASYYQGDFYKSYQHQKECLDIAENNLPLNSQDRSNILCNYGAWLSVEGEYPQAIKLMEEAYRIEREIKNEMSIRYTVGLIGQTFEKMGDYENALFHHKESLAISRFHNDDYKMEFDMLAKIRIGDCFFKLNEIDSALNHYNQALTLSENPEFPTGNVKSKQKLDVYKSIAKVQIHLNELNAASKNLNRAERLVQKQVFTDLGEIYELKGSIAFKQNDFETAINLLIKSRDISSNEYKDFMSHPKVSERDLIIAQHYEKNEQYDQSEVYFQSVLKELNLSISELEKESFISNEKFDKQLSLKAVHGLARLKIIAFEENDELDFLQQADRYLKISSKLIFDIRRHFSTTNAKFNFSSDVQQIMECAIENSVKLFNLTNDSSYLYQAFDYSESNKATTLFESIQENTAEENSGIPIETLKELSDNKIEISFLKRVINEEENKRDRNQELINKTNRALFETTKAYEHLIEHIEKEFPDYAKNKLDIFSSNFKTIKKEKIEEDASLIEYFFGEKTIFIFCLNAKKISINTIENNEELLADINTVIDYISNKPTSDHTTYVSFITAANSLYKKLIPASNILDAKKLIIIPDDNLNYLPFEVLLSKLEIPDKIDFSHARLPYLLNDYNIQYAYSSVFLSDHKNDKSPKFSQSFIGFAPSFNALSTSEDRGCDANELYDLKCNSEEVAAIEEIISGNVFTHESATKNNFDQNIGAAQILHFATHACVDDQNPLFNKIHLSDDYLSNNELYSLKLNADLAVLSACNTGAGQHTKGEGVMSLSRGFIHAGCNSVLMSLWSVDDCSTKEIMMDFYSNLSERQKKTASLKNAKTSFLERSKKIYKHPYYWAGFVLIGDDSEIIMSKNSNKLLLPSILALLLMGIFIFFIKRK